MNTQAQKKFNILLIGDYCTDVYQYGLVDRISPEAPVPVFQSINHEIRDGMAGNVYNNLEALGCIVSFLHGSESTKTRLIDIKTKQQLVRIDNDVISEPLAIVTDIPLIYDAIVISDYNKGTVSYELIQELRKEFVGPIFVDTKKTDLAKLDGCIFKINLKEFNSLITMPSDKKDLIVTCGNEGVLWDKDHFPAKTVEVSDVCGAGDTFLASLCYQYLKTEDMKQAIEFAIKASSITVQHIGVYAPGVEEIE
jgi:bifunctional ADP-heptose synthase (sugar kinase/adenylyltransferase)